MIETLFSVETVFFTFLGYPVSYLEFAGTLLYLWSVSLIAKRHILTWPVRIVSVLLFMALFYQIRLYSAAIEQVYYLVACSIGWWSSAMVPVTENQSRVRGTSPCGACMLSGATERDRAADYLETVRPTNSPDPTASSPLARAR